MTSVCGVICDNCKSFNAQCAGCGAIEGKVYWAPYLGSDTCPLYACCVGTMNLPHCGKCEKLPCALYYDTRDPSVSPEEHEKGIRERVDILRRG
ncbi:MAG TPA: DUF3795 domain-containing protein [Rectinemataceae bacterium]|nr:DUF3795 domain-containing protein [Rectinemataceae bacterium]